MSKYPKDDLDWCKSQGLLPVIVQHADSGAVLMLGYMDRAALAETQRSGLVTFFSRSKNRLWTKGETSGNTLALVSLQSDCDGDALLVRALPRGPTCHLGSASCFSAEPTATGGFLGTLDDLIAKRERERPTNSYTTTLFEAGSRRIAQKVGEEGVETALAGAAGSDAELLAECADLLFHTLVLLRSRGLSLRDLTHQLAERHAERNQCGSRRHEQRRTG